MPQQVTVRRAPEELAALLQRMLAALLPQDQGYLVQSEPPAPDAAAVLEVWHAGCRGERTLVASAAVQQAQPGWSRLSWNDRDLRTEMKPEWWRLLLLLAEFETVEGLQQVEPRGDDWPCYLPAEPLDRLTVFAGLRSLDAATGRLLQEGFKPGVVRCSRHAGPDEGGFVRYRLHGGFEQGGDYGEIWLRAAGPAATQLTICLLAMPLAALPSELRAIEALPAEEQDAAAGELAQQLLAERISQLDGKRRYLQHVFDHVLAGLPRAWLDPLNRPEQPAAPAGPAAAGGRPTDKLRLRAEKFRELKDAHPSWGYDTVASRARAELHDASITAETVRHAYRVMGWRWERANRIR